MNMQSVSDETATAIEMTVKDASGGGDDDDNDDDDDKKSASRGYPFFTVDGADVLQSLTLTREK